MNAAAQPGMLELFLAGVGWVPAVVFPTASFFQLFALARRGTSDGVSIATWSLFGVANVCLYLTIGEWGKPQVVPLTFAVPQGALFVLGDNRADSFDSRFWSNPFVVREQVVGKATVAYWNGYSAETPMRLTR